MAALLLCMGGCAGPNGPGPGWPELTLSAGAVELGSVQPGQESTRVVTFQNTGEAPLGIRAVISRYRRTDVHTRCDQPFELRDPSGEPLRCVIAPGDQAELVLTHRADAPGFVDDVIEIWTRSAASAVDALRDPALPRAELPILAEVPAASVIGVQPRLVDLGLLQPRAFRTVPIGIANPGDRSLELVRAEVRPDACDDGFELDAPVAGTPVLPGRGLLFDLHYRAGRERESARCTLDVVVRDPSDSWRGARPVQVQVRRPPAIDVTPIARLVSPASGDALDPTSPLEVQIQLDTSRLTEITAGTLVVRVDGQEQPRWTVSITSADASGVLQTTLPAAYLGQIGVGTHTLSVHPLIGGLPGHAIPFRLGNEPVSGDLDGDGFGRYDCDDTDPEVFPGAAEWADGIDQNCDGTVDEGTQAFDNDGDGFSALEGDCDDADPRIAPHQPEAPDGMDNDCDGIADNDTRASDDDGDGFTEVLGDCDDSNPLIHPTAREYVSDGQDNDCDGRIDERDPAAALGGLRLVGEIFVSASHVAGGTPIRASVIVSDPDDEPYEIAWRLGERQLGRGPSITFEPPSVAEVRQLQLSATITTPRLEQELRLDREIEVWPEGYRRPPHLGDAP